MPAPRVPDSVLLQRSRNFAHGFSDEDIQLRLQNRDRHSGSTQSSMTAPGIRYDERGASIMADQARVLELDEADGSELAHLAREVHRTRTPITLREGGQDVAVMSPAGHAPRRRRQGRTVRQADIDTALATAGACKGLIDLDKLKRDLNEAQSDDRPAIER
jgi:hypothetical protein